MDIDGLFLPIAENLIDSIFPTAVVYHRANAGTYDPVTGTAAGGETDHNIKAGVLSRKRTEGGGANDPYELMLWVHHGTTGLQFLPVTDDYVTYDSTRWKVVAVEPTYSSKGLIASKLTVRAS